MERNVSDPKEHGKCGDERERPYGCVQAERPAVEDGITEEPETKRCGEQAKADARTFVQRRHSANPRSYPGSSSLSSTRNG